MIRGWWSIDTPHAILENKGSQRCLGHRCGGNDSSFRWITYVVGT